MVHITKPSLPVAGQFDGTVDFNRLLGILNGIPGFVYLQRRDNTIAFANDAFLDLFGPDLSVPCYEKLKNRQSPCEICPVARVLKTGQPTEWEWQKDPTTCYRVFHHPIIDRDGQMAVVGVGIDISEEKKHQAELAATARRMKDAESLSRMGHFCWDVKSGEVEWSSGMFELLGYDEDAKTDITLVNESIHHPEDMDAIWAWIHDAMEQGQVILEPKQYRVIRADGSILHTQTQGKIEYLDGEPVRLFGTSIDISSIVAMEEKLIRLARFDSLTGVCNRAWFFESLTDTVKQSRRSGAGFALLSLDLDLFKQINDQFGHAAGDEVLRQVALRVQAKLRETDLVGRIGGDEFLVLLRNVDNCRGTGTTAGKLLEAIRQPIAFNRHEVTVTGSIGITCSSMDLEMEDLVKAADTAMYEAKQAGRSRYSFANGCMDRGCG